MPTTLSTGRSTGRRVAIVAIILVVLCAGCQPESDAPNKSSTKPAAKRKQFKQPALLIGLITKDNKQQPCVWLDEVDKGRLDQPPTEAHQWPQGKASLLKELSNLSEDGSFKSGSLPLRVDERLTCGTVYDVMKTCRDAGLKSVRLPALRPDERPVSLPIVRPSTNPRRRVAIDPITAVLQSRDDGSLDSIQFGGNPKVSATLSTDQRRIDGYIKSRPGEKITRNAAARFIGATELLERLNREIAKFAAQQRDLINDLQTLEEQLCVKIIAGDALQVRFLLRAIDECRYGRMTFNGKPRRILMIPNIEVIGFSPPLTKPREQPVRLKLEPPQNAARKPHRPVLVAPRPLPRKIRIRLFFEGSNDKEGLRGPFAQLVIQGRNGRKIDWNKDSKIFKVELDKLKRSLRGTSLTPGRVTVLIEAEGRIAGGVVTDVINGCQLAGFEQFSLSVIK